MQHSWQLKNTIHVTLDIHLHARLACHACLPLQLQATTAVL